MAGSVIGAAVGGAFGLLGSRSQASASRSAARTAADADREALRQAREIFDIQRDDLQPFRRSATRALDILRRRGQIRLPSDRLAVGRGGDIVRRARGIARDNLREGDPGTDFLLGESQRAIENSASSRGLLRSPGALRALQRSALGIIQQDFDQEVNRVLGATGDVFGRDIGVQEANIEQFLRLAGLGGSATGAGVTAAGGFGRTAADLTSRIGQNQAAGAINAANANAFGFSQFGNAVNRGLENFTFNRALTQRQQPQSASPPRVPTEFDFPDPGFF